MRICALRHSLVSVFFVMLLISILTFWPVGGNMWPVEPDESGAPAPDSTTPLILSSEELVFKIGSEISIAGNFTIVNPTNKTIEQPIIFPIEKIVIFNDIGWYYEHQISNLSVNGTGISYNDTEYDDRESIMFNLTFLPFEERIVHIEYETDYSTTNFKCSFKYITTTGREWNGTMDNARFKFIFYDDVKGEDLTGIDEYHSTDTHLVATIERTDWEPEDDIKISWKSPEYYEYYSIPRVNLLSPLNHSVVANYVTTLKWNVSCLNSSITDIRYDVYLSTDKSKLTIMDPCIIVARNVTAKSIEILTVMDGETYYWTVIPHSNDTNGTCVSKIWKFKLDICFCYVEHISPVNGSTVFGDSAVLRWTYINTSIYDVYFSTEEREVENKYASARMKDNITDNWTTMKGLTDGEVYYWQVVANEGYGYQPSGVWNFTVYLDSDGDGVRDSKDAYPDDPGRTSEPNDNGLSNTLLGTVIWALTYVGVFVFLMVLLYMVIRKKRDE